MSVRTLVLFIVLMSGPALPIVLILGSAGVGSISPAAEGAVATITQQDGVTLVVKNQNQLVFNAVPGPQVDHLHIYVDSELVGQTRQLKGGFTLDGMDLSSGKHSVCVKVANRAHVSTGAADCVSINVR